MTNYFLGGFNCNGLASETLAVLRRVLHVRLIDDYQKAMLFLLLCVSFNKVAVLLKTKFC